MNVSTTIPPIVQIPRGRLLGLVAGIAALAAAITWAVLALAGETGDVARPSATAQSWSLPIPAMGVTAPAQSWSLPIPSMAVTRASATQMRASSGRLWISRPATSQAAGSGAMPSRAIGAAKRWQRCSPR